MDKIPHLAPFSLRNQNEYFGGWPVVVDSKEEFAIALTFPIEGWECSATVIIRQDRKGSLSAKAYGKNIDTQKAIAQALAILSLDVDDASWQEVGKIDAFISGLQEKYTYIRPSLFHSPYEAAVGFIIGQRISIKQRQAIQARLAEQYGEIIEAEGQTYHAFPSPQVLVGLQETNIINPAKLERLHGIAATALEGKLDRKYLLSLSNATALAELESLNGIGPFYASGILYRGAGVVDDVTDDSLTKYAVMQAYNLPNEPSQPEVLEIAQNWRPYRMWCEVLLHIWLRREVGMPKKRF